MRFEEVEETLRVAASVIGEARIARLRDYIRDLEGRLGFSSDRGTISGPGFQITVTSAPCPIPGCVRAKGHPNFHCTSDQIAARVDR